MGAVSILFSIAIAVDSIHASRLVRGEIGNTVFALAAVANRAARSILIPAAPHHTAPLALPAMSDSGPPAGGGRVWLVAQEEAALGARGRVTGRIKASDAQALA